MLDGVSKLEPGSLLTYDQNGINITQWNNNERDLFSLDSSERYSAKDLRDTIITSVHDRMISDVPLGVFLSGGIDSAVIATAMSKKEKNINTFTVGFPDSEKYDESQYALKMARHLNSNHTEINITNNNILDSLDLVFDGLDEPFSDNSSISTYILSQHVKNHITVALSGDGGDEVFGGYRKYKASMYADKYRSMPNLIQDSVNLLIGKFHDKYPESFLSIYRFLKFANESSLEASLSQIMGTGIEDNLILGGPNASVESLIKDQLSTIEIDDPINKLLIFDQKNSLADQMLTKVDRMSMAASLEVRSPFLDHRVVSMANKIKGSRKISIGKNKPLLEQAFKNDIPKYVFRAKKKGFGVPMSDWIRKEILDIAKWSTDSDRLADQGLFNHCIPTQWLDKHLNYKGDYSKQIWSMIVFQKWYERRG